MSRLLAMVMVAALGCAVTSDDARTVPWLRGLTVTGLATAPTSAPSPADDDRGLDEVLLDDECHSGARRALSLAVDLDPRPGIETIRASIAGGLVVEDDRGRRLAGDRIATCGGSADELVALATGDAGIGRPVIAVVATRGGHAEATTTLLLLTVDDGVVTRAFAASIEERDGDTIRTGATSLDGRGGLLYRPPSGERPMTWTYDPASGRFVAPP